MAVFPCMLLMCAVMHGAAPVYVALWFDTEDYIDPAADDAALRIATDLTKLGVSATFKVVGEKSRVLESRKRTDVVRALSRHAIGYHSNLHSVHPTPAEYLRRFGYLEGATEFERRESAGAQDVQRVFGVTPVCYGQPGSSWGPQTNLALRKMGIPVYLDEGEQVGLNSQPFWYGGLLYVFNMGSNQFRARLDIGTEDREAYAQFDSTVSRMQSQGGGVISIYYHPTEFVNTEFWDAVNFAAGANPSRREWKRPASRSKQESERCYRVLEQFVRHMKGVAGVEFVTAMDLLRIYGSPTPPTFKRRAFAEHLSKGINFLSTETHTFSPADMVVQLLGLEPQVVDGPTARGTTSLKSSTMPRAVFEHAIKDAADFVRRNYRLPNQVFLGAETLSLPDFTATLAAYALTSSDAVPLTRGIIQFEQHFATDPVKAFNWPIHPPGFAAPELLELARLQGWTLKPARLAPRNAR
jgi:hypothetical protein